MSHIPVIAISIGDPGGIGPEIAVQASQSARVLGRCRPLLVGATPVVEAALTAVDLADQVALQRVEDPAAVSDVAPEQGRVALFDTASLSAEELHVGTMTAAGGRAAAHDTAVAVELARHGHVAAVTSGPVSKQALQAGGKEYPGQTEYIGDLCGTDEAPLTVLVGGPMRVALVTSHVSLRAAIEGVTRARVERVARALVQALQDGFGIAEPHVAVAGLNPHAGDNGLLGGEDNAHLVPAIEGLRAEGLHVTGPHPADSLFAQAEHGAYDGILAMYHDQGVVPLKRHKYATFAYGLPIVRTTAGHGTAYDIAGTGTADPTTLENALDLAADLVAARAATAGGR